MKIKTPIVVTLLVVAVVIGYLPYAERLSSERDYIERHNRIVKSLVDSKTAIITLENNGDVAEWDGNAEWIFGRSAKEVVGKTLEGRVIPPGEYSDRHRDSVIAAFEGMDPENPRVRIILCYGVRKDGSPVPIMIRLHIPFEGDKILALINEIPEREVEMFQRTRGHSAQSLSTPNEALDTPGPVPAH